MAETQQELCRFYRSNLATVVWDPERNRPLAEFVDGQFYTEDARTIAKLRELGYPQVSLDATEPPDILFEKGKSLQEGENVKLMGKGVTEESELHRVQHEQKQAELRARAQAQVETPKVENTTELSPADIALAKAGNEQAANTKQPVSKATKTNKTPNTGSGASNVVEKAKKIAKTRKIKRRKK